ncbi:MAG: hypothetical protein M3Y33_11860 [Actinomycetota bacterium]|nr:hypothetical protein [Actinomycetota bacterium]
MSEPSATRKRATSRKAPAKPSRRTAAATAARDREQSEQILRCRSEGMALADIAARLEITPVRAGKLLSEALAARAAALEASDSAAALEMERLDAAERRVQVVASEAADFGQHELVLAAVERQLQISERRAEVQLPGQAGAMEASVAADLARLPAELQATAAAMLARMLARRLDAGVAAREMTPLCKELRVTLEDLAALAPRESDNSTADQLRQRRADRELKRQAAETKEAGQ